MTENLEWTQNPVSLSLQVMLKLKKSKNGKECPFLVLHVAQLGIDTKVRKYDMEATTYIKTISMKSLEFTGLWHVQSNIFSLIVQMNEFLFICLFSDSNGEALGIISSSAESGADLLEVKYFKVTVSF